jgi:hypothetical protein
MNHTPGPWSFDGHGINSPEGQRICKVSHSDPYGYPEGKAVRNARFDADSRLIAAAPDLLECVKKLVLVIDGGDERARLEEGIALELIKKVEAQ